MGMYIFVTEDSIKNMKSVKDKEKNELFQEALQYHSELLIEQKTNVQKRWLKKDLVYLSFDIYHESRAFDGSPYQAAFSFAGSGSRNVASAYLYGIINGALAQQKLLTPEQ